MDPNQNTNEPLPSTVSTEPYQPPQETPDSFAGQPDQEPVVQHTPVQQPSVDVYEPVDSPEPPVAPTFEPQASLSPQPPQPTPQPQQAAPPAQPQPSQVSPDAPVQQFAPAQTQSPQVGAAIPQQPNYAMPVAGDVEDDPGKTLGIVSLILSFVPFAGLIGLILGIVATKKSSAASKKNGLALAGIILSVLNILAAIAFVILVIFGPSTLSAQCQELGPGTHIVDGATYTCE